MNGVPLDPLAIPLRGLHLIEASAGTGKTYTIAHLVLRLVLEAGLPIDRILVLTFTEAATQELKERIAARLRKARIALDGEAIDDALLAGWLARLADPVLARARLDAALADLDRASVFTIHGFCARVLKDFAFESGAPFDAELTTDEQVLRRTVAADFWRRRMAAADRDETAWLCSALPQGPDSLLAVLGSYLGGAAPEPVALARETDAHAQDDGSHASVAAVLARVREIHRRLKAVWPTARDEVAALLDANPNLKANVYSAGAVAKALAGLDALVRGPLPGALPDKLELLGTAKLQQSVRKGCTAPGHPLFDLCEGLTAIDFAALEAARRAVLLAEALDYLRRELNRRKRERRVLFYDDLLAHTAEALAGPRGAGLAARIRTAWPQALIDEFQDTDALQYRIFQIAHGDALDRDEGLGLYLIGDPKQAIYGFRGADIFAYIAARREAQARGAIHTLGTNRRSASGLVGAVNRIFERARAPFVFAGDIPFAPVGPGPDADGRPLLIDGARATPLVFRWLPLDGDKATKKGDRIKSEPALEAAVEDCARQIAALLAGPATLDGEALKAGDIAVLVRAHREGSAVRAALSRLGIGSVSIGQETVYESEEASGLAAILAALRPGAGDAALRGALATRALGWSAADLAGLDADEARWERVLADFAACRAAWAAQGFMAAFERLLHGQDIPARLRRGPEGERRLTNLLHLAELAQSAARDHPGPEGLVRWLADRRADPRGAGEAALLRLESDENLVQVVTFHKSKGLEYPVVFLPLPWSKGLKTDAQAPVVFHDREGLAARLDLGSPAYADHRALWEEEDLAERLRLLYVALTRAKQRCVIHWGAVNGVEASAAAYLLHQGPAGEPAAERLKSLSDAAMRAEIAALAQDAPAGSIAVEDAHPHGPAPRVPGTRASEALRPLPFAGRTRDDWRMLSFSGLAHASGELRVAGAQGAPADRAPGGEGGAAAADPGSGPGFAFGGMPAAPFLALSRFATDPELPDYDGLDGPFASGRAAADTDPESGEPALPLPVEPIFRFPRGTRPGHCLHDFFERLDFRTAEGPRLKRAAREALARHGLDPQWSDTLAELAGRVLDTPLGPDGLKLRGIGPADRRNELEFHFALDGLDPSALAAVLAEQGIGAVAAPVAAADPACAPAAPPAASARASAGAAGSLNGLMKGFMDLVLRHRGRFYILDYKSNHLGDRLDDYGPAGLARAMDAHRYRLQILIYSVALHRWLKLRLPDYDYDRHMGGAVYLFLRGMRPEHGPARGVYRERPARALIETLDRLFSPRRETAA